MSNDNPNKFTNEELKNLIMYEVSASVMLECLSYVQKPLRRSIENQKYRSRAEKKQAIRDFDKSIEKQKQLLAASTKIIENDYPVQTDKMLDEIFKVLEENIEVT